MMMELTFPEADDSKPLSSAPPSVRREEIEALNM